MSKKIRKIGESAYFISDIREYTASIVDYDENAANQNIVVDDEHEAPVPGEQDHNEADAATA